MHNPQMVVSWLLEALNVTSDNEFPLLNKKIEDFLYEIDSQEWANIVNKTARKEKLFSVPHFSVVLQDQIQFRTENIIHLHSQFIHTNMLLRILQS